MGLKKISSSVFAKMEISYNHMLWKILPGVGKLPQVEKSGQVQKESRRKHMAIILK